ncbi:MAG: CPBP family intramembrane metalloprotease [Gammaproteobacteria bacterium]|nr:CPBP family intramembrane metalloprotease [Gammaproteobacteria bacterium]
MRREMTSAEFIFIFCLYKITLIAIFLLLMRLDSSFKVVFDIIHATALIIFLATLFKPYKLLTTSLAWKSEDYSITVKNFFVLISLIAFMLLFRASVNTFNFITYSIFIPEQLIDFVNSPKAYVSTSWDLALSSTLSAPILEEIEYRLILLFSLTKRFNVLTSVIISSIIFALFHINYHAFFFGIALAFIFIKFGLIASIVCHSIFNVIHLLFSEQFYYNFYSSYPNLSYTWASLFILLFYLLIRYFHRFQVVEKSNLTFLRAGY